MEHAKHIVRAVLLLVVIAMVFVFGRHFAIPESFGEHGYYRAGSIKEFMAQGPAHGGPGACLACHDEEGEAHVKGGHKTVSCETCHAPLATHVANDEKVGQMLVQRSYRLCAYCHQHLVARPETFPQIVIPDHVTANDAEMSEEVCLECHNAHDPSE